MSTTGKLIAPGLLLFIDSLLAAAANWIYWLVISKFTLASEVGQATTLYSIVLLVGTSIQLGLEYPLLKQSHTEKSRTLGTALFIELVLFVTTLPILLYTVNTFFHTYESLVWLAVGILFFSSVGFVTRFVLLGISNVRSLVIIDIIGNCLKFAIGFILVSSGFGVYGILLSFLSYTAFVASAGLAILLKTFGIAFEKIQAKFVKELTKLALTNTPFKLAKVFIITLSVILLTPFAVSNSDIGIFYICLMISIIAGSLASSIALMVIPASSKMRTDLSSAGLRIALSLTAPIISALVVAPKFTLSLIGTQYVTGDIVLLILSIGILPFSVAFNAISSFNNNGENRKIIVIGLVEFLTFLAAFFYLVPNNGINGAGFSVLMAFIAASIPSIIWLGRKTSKYVANSMAAVIAGVMIAYMFGFLIALHPIVLIIVSFTITSIVIIAIKNISLVELKQIVGVVKK